jgi:hypothetical protein
LVTLRWYRQLCLLLFARQPRRLLLFALLQLAPSLVLPFLLLPPCLLLLTLLLLPRLCRPPLLLLLLLALLGCQLLLLFRQQGQRGGLCFLRFRCSLPGRRLSLCMLPRLDGCTTAGRGARVERRHGSSRQPNPCFKPAMAARQPGAC